MRFDWSLLLVTPSGSLYHDENLHIAMVNSYGYTWSAMGCVLTMGMWRLQPLQYFRAVVVLSCQTVTSDMGTFMVELDLLLKFGVSEGCRMSRVNGCHVCSLICR